MPRPSDESAADRDEQHDEVLLRAVQEGINEAILTVDREGLITSWNKGAEDLLGYQADEIVGSSCRRIRGTTCMGRQCREGDKDCPMFRDGGIWSRDCEVRHRSGRMVRVLKNGRLIRDAQGQVIGGVETMIDVSHLLPLPADPAADPVSAAAAPPAPRRPAADGGPPNSRTMVAGAPCMREVLQLTERAAVSDVSVLITGESGTGKELLAERLHRQSPRAPRPFVRVDCSALSETLLESELFGHSRGAFTGAEGRRLGRFEIADGGTLFFDEIGELSLPVQKKLLRFLQSRQFERVGDNVTRQVDVRIVSATHRDLRGMVDEGSFREDLYWRMSAFPIVLPPLRRRMDDVIPLAEHFLRGHWGEERRASQPGLSAALRQVLLGYDWPGNCRELENAVWYAATVCTGEALLPEHLPPYLRSQESPRQSETTELVAALERCQWNRSRTAALLGISRVTLWRRMQKLGIGGK